MKIGGFDTDRAVLIIAEIGNNHEGSYVLAEELIGRAAEAGADAVKFQSIVPEKLVSPKEVDRLAQLRRFSLSNEQMEKLKGVADRASVLFLSTPFALESVQFLNKLVPAFKISSGDNNFLPLIAAIAETTKPIILSAGLATIEEIKIVRNFIFDIWDRKGVSHDELAILHCIVNYPTSNSDANLLFIRALETLGVTVGYSDHTVGIKAALLSVALGARIVEKHFTISKDYSDFHDHKISADPKDMAELTQGVRETLEMLGDGQKRIIKSEEINLKKVRRSIVAARPLPEGHSICMEDLIWVRPKMDDGLEPGQESLIINKKLNKNLSEGDLILVENLIAKENT